MNAKIAVLVLASVVGLDAAAKKFPWVSDDLNKPCGKTELEWRCLAARVRAEPVPLERQFNLVGLEASPMPQGLLIKAAIAWKPGLPGKQTIVWQNLLNDTIWHGIRPYIQKEIWKFDDDFLNTQIDLYLGGKLIARTNKDGFQMLVKP